MGSPLQLHLDEEGVLHARVLTPLSVRTLRIGALVNASNGGYELGFENELEAVLKEMGCRVAKVGCVRGEAVDAALQEARSVQLAILIVVEGDGTPLRVGNPERHDRR